MSKSLNKAQIIGHLGQDPEIRYTQSGTPVANLSVATSWKPKEGDEQTEWHKVTLWARDAEVAEEYLKKGARVYIEGYLQTRKWQDKDDVDHYTTSIIATNLIMLSSKDRDEEGDEQEQRKPKSRRREATPVVDEDIGF